MDSYRIGEIAQRVGISVAAVRYYERLGLVATAPRTGSGNRRARQPVRRTNAQDISHCRDDDGDDPVTGTPDDERQWDFRRQRQDRRRREAPREYDEQTQSKPQRIRLPPVRALRRVATRPAVAQAGSTCANGGSSTRPVS
jgi:DNA-binding transcriptional MerR regulator